MVRPISRDSTDKKRRPAFYKSAVASTFVACAMMRATSASNKSSCSVACALLTSLSPSVGLGGRGAAGGRRRQRQRCWQPRDDATEPRYGSVAAYATATRGCGGRCDEQHLASFPSTRPLPSPLRHPTSSVGPVFTLPSTRSRMGAPLWMALDSRELRFYSSSTMPVSRADDTAQETTTETTTTTITTTSVSSSTTMTTTTKATTTSTSQTTATPSSYSPFPASGGGSDLLDFLAAPVASIYHNGLAGIMNSFDSDIKRAFAVPLVSGGQKICSASAGPFSTSSALFSTNVSAAGGCTQNKARQSQPRGDSYLTQQQQQQRGGRESRRENNCDTIKIHLTDEERELFDLLRTVTKETGIASTLRVAGGWVRDKILATPEFHERRVGVQSDACDNRGKSVIPSDIERMKRITSKFKGEKGDPSVSDKSLAVTLPVDIDIAVDVTGREFADEFNSWLSAHGRETHSVGVVLKNPEKSKHLETATMRVNNYWIDFVNLRAEEYTSDSRIPDLMRIGTAEEDAFRRDLTINALFYNINEGRVEDMTGRGLEDLRMGVVDTPLPPLTTLLDDPLRVLRSVRFAARLRFGMSESLREAAADSRVKTALAQKVSRERVGNEVDLMLKSRDPVGAMRLLVNLGLVGTVFPLPDVEGVKAEGGGAACSDDLTIEVNASTNELFEQGLNLLANTHDHLCDCKANPPLWCEAKRVLKAGAVNGVGHEDTRLLTEDEDARRLLWYAAFLKPLLDRSIRGQSDDEAENKKKPRKANRPPIIRLMVDEVKRPLRDAEAVEKIMKAADSFTVLVTSGSDQSALSVLLSGSRVVHSRRECPEGDSGSRITTAMNNKVVDPDVEDDPVWKHCMEFRMSCAEILKKVGPLWRAALILSLSEQLLKDSDGEFEYAIEGDTIYETQEEIRNGIVNKYDSFAAAIMQLGLIGIWHQQPIINGDEMKKSVLPKIPIGPVFREVMQEQSDWITTHPGGGKMFLVNHLRAVFPDFA